MSYDQDYYKARGPLFGQWKIVKQLGAGTFGKVFKIERTDFSGTYVAAMKAITIPSSPDEIQTLMNDGLSENDAKTYIRNIAKDIVAEFALMAELKGNSNIVSYEDHEVYDHEDGFGCDILIRMELLRALPDHIKEPGMTQMDVIQLGIDMCKALELCQKHDIIHRDIKPENIFINKNGDYKLGDFGIARQAEKVQANHTKTGTPNYMAPEVRKGLPYDHSVDMYSLGIVMYKLLNHNRLPFLPAYPKAFDGTDVTKALDRRMDGEKLPIPDGTSHTELCNIVLKACEYMPKDRYSSPTEMRRDLEKFREKLENPEPKPKPDPEPDPDDTIAVTKPEYNSDNSLENNITANTGKNSGSASRLIISGKGNIDKLTLNSSHNNTGDLSPAGDLTAFVAHKPPRPTEPPKDEKTSKSKKDASAAKEKKSEKESSLKKRRKTPFIGDLIKNKKNK